MTNKTLLVRGATRIDALDVVRYRGIEAYAMWDKMLRYHEVEPRFTQQALAVAGNGHVPTTDIDPDRPSILEPIANSGFLRRFITKVLGYRHALRSPSAFQIRRVKPPSVGRPTYRAEWHQDERFFLINTPDATTYPLSAIMWLPLMPCGVDAPGVSVVVGSDHPTVMEATPPEGWGSYIASHYGADKIWSPEMAPGDMLVFTSRAIHGSNVTNRMRSPRMSLELRCGIDC